MSIGMISYKKFFLVTFAVSWACFIPVALLSHQSQTTSLISVLQQVLLFLGVISPSFVALWLTTRSSVPGETQKLIEKVFKWSVNIKWYIFASVFLILVKLLAALIHRLATGIWPQFGVETWYVIIIAIIFSTWVQAGEEIGWRGFALPRMSVRLGLPLSTLLLGIIWACWHLPLFFVQGADTFGQSFPLYVLQVMALSVILGWLYWRTKESLLLTMLMHASINNTKGIVPSGVQGASNTFTLSSSLVAWLTVLLLWICAAFFLIQMRKVKQLS